MSRYTITHGLRIRPDIASKVVPGFPWSREAWLRWKEYRDSSSKVDFVIG